MRDHLVEHGGEGTIPEDGPVGGTVDTSSRRRRCSELRTRDGAARSVVRRTLAVLGIFAFFAFGCATGPNVGVRSSYETSRLGATSVVPFFALSQFSLDEAAIATRLDWAESTAVNWLEERGLRVVTPERTRHRLQTGDSWNHFTEGGLLRSDLSDAFEAANRDQKATAQVSLARRIRDDEGFETRYVLFGELLYHTKGTCRTRADNYQRRTRVVVTPDAPEEMPRPCIVSHFQARLVDVESGATVWYNRRLRELHIAEHDERWTRKNLRGVVHGTLAGDDGLTTLIE